MIEYIAIGIIVNMTTDKKLPTLKCLRCRHEWIPITMYPKYCPICNSPNWNKPKLKYPGQRERA